MFCAINKCFGAGDERVENTCSNFSHTHTEMITTHRHSYHALVITSEYATPTSNTVEPCLADTPEIWTPIVMWTLHAVPKVSYVLKQPLK